ncbi:MAG: Hsp33 family molecular chaperone HslO [Cellvibrionales bacterium]|mgnify:FL=1|jgi:molecular chaperone Hsp33|nr:Hsp33 family molecular chaperone HslO [Cellvibrionales bacterium]MBK8676588.1 Hsp33 family molecular chaperone HslO [Cellvibrionales bacterium]TXH50650.1 MAG: Hsp33 family molecular chaperone HslO [Cellvibrionales bacterium]
MSHNDKQQDARVRFLFEDAPVRGAWVYLQHSVQAMPAFISASPAGKILLGESVAAAALLSANIKLQGRLAIQARGDGALRLLVAESSQNAGVRGVIELDDRAENTLALRELLGDGYLAVTLLPDVGESYQGIVPLQGARLQDCLAAYFQQSEQLETALWLASDGETAAGLLLQAMPGAQDDLKGWQHVHALASTISNEELLSLSCEQLLHRLYHQETVRVFDAEPVQFQCSCNTQRSAAALATLGREDLLQLFQETPVVKVDCHFCGKIYQYSERDIDKILGEISPTLH